MKLSIIINADDFGLTKDTNIAVEELVQIGTLTSTSVMVNMPYAAEIISLLKYEKLGIGLHFNLTQGKPILDTQTIPSLVNNNGCFYNIMEFKKRAKKGLIKIEDVLKELIAQYNILAQWVGVRLTHIDSHQDINKLSLISRALCVFAGDLNKKIGLRIYNKCYIVDDRKFKILHPSINTIFIFGIKRSIIETIFRRRRSKLSSYFNLTDGMLFAMNNNVRTLLNLLPKISFSEKYKDMILEIMCHPATSTNELKETKMLTSRVEEYEILKSVYFQNVKEKFNLINFSNL